MILLYTKEIHNWTDVKVKRIQLINSFLPLLIEGYINLKTVMGGLLLARQKSSDQMAV